MWGAVEEDSVLFAADEHVSRAEFQEALRVYSEIELRTNSEGLRFEAMIRRFSVMLQLGRASEVLTQAASFANSKPPAELPAILAFIVAYAYEGTKDIDQSLAWLSLCYRLAEKEQGNKQGNLLTNNARTEAARLISRIKEQRFDDYSAKWSSDRFVATLFSEERARRALGEHPQTGPVADWFNPSTYLPSNISSITSPVDTAPSQNKQIAIGALLPLSGAYAAHGKRALAGMNLAAKDLGNKIRIIPKDSGQDDLSLLPEFQNLVNNDQIKLLLGPLLAKSAETLLSSNPKVAVLTFTKKPGITMLSNSALRLGVTAEDQVLELERFLAPTANTRIAIVLAASSNQQELVSLFSERMKAKGSILKLINYKEDDELSLSASIKILEDFTPDYIFSADTIPVALKLLSRLEGTELRKTVTFIGTAAWDDAVAIRGYGEILSGSKYATPFFVGSRRTEVRDFVDRYQREFNEPPDLISAQAYDAVKLADLILRDVGMIVDNIDSLPPAIKDPLTMHRKERTFRGVSGLLTVATNGEVHRRMSIVSIERGATSGITATEIISGGVPTGGE